MGKAKNKKYFSLKVCFLYDVERKIMSVFA
jgi:hypothetical protein